MLPYRLQGVTLMHIQVFILCAERLNFTRAAAELHITPGMVSKKIAALESALELPLFIREKNRVTLTPEGQKLLSAWGPMAKAFLREAEELRSKDTEDTTIRVGLGDVTNLDRYFIPLSSAFSAEEECSFRFVLKPGFDLFDELASGSCDVVFAPKFMERGFSQYRIWTGFLLFRPPSTPGWRNPIRCAPNRRCAWRICATWRCLCFRWTRVPGAAGTTK